MASTTKFLVFLLPFLFSCNRQMEVRESPFLAIPDSLVKLAGNEISSASFQALSGHLGKAMGQGGPLHALSYCNSKAIPLTDSLSGNWQVSIKRTSSKIRNSANTPSERERSILADFEKRPPSPNSFIHRTDSSISFYKPIQLTGACLTCHGTPGQELSMELNQEIKELYPNDAATHYQNGAFRGMWVVEFNNAETLKKLIQELGRPQ